VEKDAKEFVNDVVRRWKVDLNHVDPADGKTALDYIEVELAKAGDSSNAPILRRYYDLFRKHGAKHRREL
jgi:hypothetical protein